MHADNRKNDILVRIEGPQNGSDDSTITAEDTIISLNPNKIIFFESTLQCGQQCFECWWCKNSSIHRGVATNHGLVGLVQIGTIFVS